MLIPITAELSYLNALSYVTVEWNKRVINLQNDKSFLIFRNSLLKMGRPLQNLVDIIHDPMGIKFLTRLRLALSHLNDH